MQRFSAVLVLAVALIALGWWVMPKATVPEADAQEKKESRTEFAADRDPAPLKVSPAPFDGERAIGYLKEVCRIGPRISGTDGMKQQQEMLKKHFEAQGAKVDFQRFKAKQRSQKEQVDMTNLVVSYWPDRPKRVILCSHYDTRPIADQEADQRKWKETFISANDGGSGVAFLMELAHHIKELNIKVGVDFVIFDGEEYILDARPDVDRYFFGSDHFADEYTKTPPKHRYIAGVLLDLFAGQNAKFPYEQNSVFRAGAVLADIWTIARELKAESFVTEYGDVINDDHLALNRAGIPTVDIIDFKYPHWHRLSDTPENCSAATMGQVAKVLTTWISRVK
jgi:glutaminyl-peptide cyclotransferase